MDYTWTAHYWGCPLDTAAYNHHHHHHHHRIPPPNTATDNQPPRIPTHITTTEYHHCFVHFTTPSPPTTPLHTPASTVSPPPRPSFISFFSICSILFLVFLIFFITFALKFLRIHPQYSAPPPRLVPVLVIRPVLVICTIYPLHKIPATLPCACVCLPLSLLKRTCSLSCSLPILS
jgi:hypothetical protein